MTARPPRTLVVGESLIDVVETADGRVEHVGGSPMNVAVGLARLGGSVGLVTAIGPDARGRAIRHHVTSSGASLINQASDPSAPTSSATAVIQADGSAQYDFDVTWDISEIDANGFAALHTGSIGAALRPGRDRVVDLFCSSPPGVLRSFDPNIRPDILGPREEILDTVRLIAGRCHVVKLSDEDADWLHPGEDAEQIVARYRELGASVVVITRGGEGFVLACGDRLVDVPATATTVVDTIGAGDSFMAGLLFALGTPAARIGLLSGQPDHVLVLNAASFAARCAAVTVGRAGADLPTLTDLQSEPTPHPALKGSK